MRNFLKLYIHSNLIKIKYTQDNGQEITQITIVKNIPQHLYYA